MTTKSKILSYLLFSVGLTPSSVTVRLLTAAIICGLTSSISYSQNLTLPTYRVEIAPEHLRRLIADPTLPDFFPAVVTYRDRDYNAEVKFRGASALHLPKHSWRIEFTDLHPRSFSSINLDAEYYDRSLIRDHLSMELGKRLGLPVPDERFVSLIVNDVYYGVYLEVEPINNQFFARRNFGVGEIFASISHMGRGAPFINDDQFIAAYELQEGTRDAYDRLGMFLTFIHNASMEELSTEFGDWLDSDNVLEYFALQYMIGNWDGFAKNYHLFKGQDDRYLFVPWDCDASFGNDWAGNWANDYTRLYYDLLAEQAIFRRALEIEGNRERFISLVREGRETWFPQLDSLVQALHDDMRNDAYQDTLKRALNREFDAEFDSLRGYISNRAEALQNIDHIYEIPAEPQTTVSENYLSDADQSITISIKTTDSPRYAFFQVIDSVGQERDFQANDNGDNGDSTANDGVFTRIFNPGGLTFPAYYTTWLYFNETEAYPFDRCGLFLQHLFPLQVPMFRINADPPDRGDVLIVGVDEVLESSSFLIGLSNTRGRSVNLSACYLSLNSGYRRTMLPILPDIADGDTIWITNHLSLMRSAFPERKIAGAMYCQPSVGDTIILSRTDSGIISTNILREFRRVEDPASRVVINEVNYNSSNDFNTGDWIEITAINDDQDLSGWRVSDARSDHFYIIPPGTRLSPGEYIVIAEDPELFRSNFEGVDRVIGGFNFSFSNSTDDVRLLDATRTLVDWVHYEQGNLWPAEADGNGSTLELINPSLSNYGWQNWVASEAPNVHGTPGRQNQAYANYSSNDEVGPPIRVEFVGAFPNPFNGSIRIEVLAGGKSLISVSIFDLLGRQITKLTGRTDEHGSLALFWKPSVNIPAGVYYARFDGKTESGPLTLLHLK